jgi:Tfp pilus assembly protein PilW
VISSALVALLLGSIVFLGTIAIVFALTLRNQWQKISDQDRSRES